MLLWQVVLCFEDEITLQINCSSFYGSVFWISILLHISRICSSWRAALGWIWLHNARSSWARLPPLDELCRSDKFTFSCLKSANEIVRSVHSIQFRKYPRHILTGVKFWNFSSYIAWWWWVTVSSGSCMKYIGDKVLDLLWSLAVFRSEVMTFVMQREGLTLLLRNLNLTLATSCCIPQATVWKFNS